MALQLIDLFETTVSSPYVAGDSVLLLATTTGLPAAGDYWLAVYDPANSATTYEVFKVTGAPSGSAVPVLNGQSGTSPQNHAAGQIAYASILTAAALTQLKLDAAVGLVPSSRQILTGTGLTGGGTLAADRTLSMVDDASNQRLRVSSIGTLIGTRKEINFAVGGSVSISASDNPASNRVDVTFSGIGITDPTSAKGDMLVRNVASVQALAVGTNGQVLTADSAQILGVKWATPSTGGSQTPWTTDIDAANHALNNVWGIGIGRAAAAGYGIAVNGGALPATVNSAYIFSSYAVADPNTDFFNVSVLRVSGGGNWSDSWWRIARQVDASPMASIDFGPGWLGLNTAGAQRAIVTNSGIGMGGIQPIMPFSAGPGLAPIKVASYYDGNAGSCFGMGVAASTLTFGAQINPNTGTPQMVLTGAGKLGLGLIAPTAWLHALSASQGPNGNWYDPANYAAAISHGMNAVQCYGLLVTDYWRAAENFVFCCDGRSYSDGTVTNDAHAPYFVVRGDGLVGIRTASPGSVLTVEGAVEVRTGSYLMLRPSNNSYDLGCRAVGVTGGQYSLQFGAASFSNTAMAICSNGTVGIGGTFATNAPTYLLHVVPAVTATTVAGASHLCIGEATNNVAYRMQLGYFIDASAYKGSIQVYAGGTPYPLILNGDGGQVGIGKLSPAYALDVTGDVNCTGAFRINGVALAAGSAVTTQTTYSAGQKSFGLPYQNTSGKPMLVTVAVGSSSTTCTAAAYADAGSNPTTMVAYQVTQGSLVACLSFWVLPSHWYKVTAPAANSSYSSWVEWK